MFDSKIKRAQDKSRFSKRISPYLLAGISAIYFHPTSHLGNQLRMNSYTGVTLGVPFGGGLRFPISRRMSLLSELLYVTSLSDRLDNHLGHGGQGSSDSYLMAMIKLQMYFARFSKW